MPVVRVARGLAEGSRRGKAAAKNTGQQSVGKSSAFRMAHRMLGKTMSDPETHLQSRIAHLERTVEDLSDELARHAKALSVAERRILKLMEQAAERELDAGSTIPLADQRPPHY